jgi:hypothetical protein
MSPFPLPPLTRPAATLSPHQRGEGNRPGDPRPALVLSSCERVARKAGVEDRPGGLAPEDMGIDPELEGDRHLGLPREDSRGFDRIGGVQPIQPLLGAIEPAAGLIGVAQAVVGQGQAIGVQA